MCWGKRGSHLPFGGCEMCKSGRAGQEIEMRPNVSCAPTKTHLADGHVCLRGGEQSAGALAPALAQDTLPHTLNRDFRVSVNQHYAVSVVITFVFPPNMARYPEVTVEIQIIYNCLLSSSDKCLHCFIVSKSQPVLTWWQTSCRPINIGPDSGRDRETMKYLKIYIC